MESRRNRTITGCTPHQNLHEGVPRLCPAGMVPSYQVHHNKIVLVLHTDITPNISCSHISAWSCYSCWFWRANIVWLVHVVCTTVSVTSWHALLSIGSRLSIQCQSFQSCMGCFRKEGSATKDSIIWNWSSLPTLIAGDYIVVRC